MTREYAVELFNSEINNFKKLDYSPKEAVQEYIDAMEMAIKALEREPKWIPVSERLPEDNTYVLTTIKVPNRIARVRSSQYEGGFFFNDNGDTWKTTDMEVIAWMPLPEPYVPDINIGKMAE